MRPLITVPLLFAGVIAAEIIDRIAIVVGNNVVTAGEVTREVRLTDFLNGTPLELGPEAKRKAAERLVEQELIRRELELTRYPAQPESEADRMLDQIRKSRFQSDQQFQGALKQYGLDAAALKAHLRWQITALSFIELRFRPGVQVSEEEIRAEFEARKGAGTLPATAALDDLHSRIEEELTERKVEAQLAEWLKRARARSQIEIRKEALQ